MIESLLINRPAWIQLGLVLAHFLWQGAVIALLLAAALWLLRHRSPNARYVLCGAAMLLMAACPALTLSYVRAHPLPILAIQQRTVPPQINLPPHQNIPETEIVNAAPEQETIENVDVLPNRVLKETVTSQLDHPRAYPSAPDTSALRRLWLARGLEWSALVWSIGVLVLSLRLMIGWWRLRRHARRDTECLPEAVEAIVRRLSERLRVTHRVRVLAAKAWNGPAAFGLLKPVVLMPVAVLTQCPLELIEAMIAHELAHIRRYDLWVNLLQRVIETLLFYHPAIWWVSGRMRMERELCCDDLAVQATGRRADYATALVEICRLQPSWVTPAMAAGIFGPKLSLLTRVRRVLQSSSIPGESNRGRFWLSGPLSILIAGAFVFIACLRAADTHSVAATQPAARVPAVSSQPAETETSAVELIGVTKRRAGQPVTWWTPSGLPLANEPYADPWIHSNEDNAYEFAVRVPQDATSVALWVKDKSTLISVETYIPLDKNKKLLPGLRAFVLPFKPEEMEAKVQLRAATGEWEKVEDWELPNWPQSGVIDSQSGVVMTWPREEHGSIRVQLTHTYASEAARLIAIDSQGKLHTPREESGGKGTGVIARVYVYDDLAMKDLKRLEFQGRPYNLLAVFENVSLQMGHKTQMQAKLTEFMLKSTQQRRLSSSASSRPVLNSERTTAIEMEQLQASLLTAAIRPAGDPPVTPPPLLIHFDNTPLRKAIEEFGQLSGLGVIGINGVDPGVAVRPITLVISQPLAFDEALTAFDQVLLDSAFWMVRREHGLVIRPLTEWYQHIPAQNWFASEADYRQAHLPEWEFARVPYKPRALGTEYLAKLIMDAVPYNTARAMGDNNVPSPNDSGFDLAGIVYFINRQLDILERRDMPTPNRSGPSSQPVPVRSIGRAVEANPPAGDSLVPVQTLTGGIIADIKVKNGQEVNKGDLLVQLDDEEIQLDLQAAILRAKQTSPLNPVTVLEMMAEGKKRPDESETRNAETSSPVNVLADIEVRRCQLRLDRTQIKSPANGTIRMPDVDPTQLVGKGITAGDTLMFIETAQNVPPDGQAPTSPARRPDRRQRDAAITSQPASGRGTVLTEKDGEITKTYDVRGPVDDIAIKLDKTLVTLWGYYDAPYIKPFPIGKQIIVTAKPAQFKSVEEWLEKLDKPSSPRTRHFVKLVLGKGRMTFQGDDVTWDELPKRLKRVPDREHTVFEFANTSEDLTMREFNEARFRAMRLQQELGFEYFSEVGEHPLGSKGEPDQVLPETPVTTQPAAAPKRQKVLGIDN